MTRRRVMVIAEIGSCHDGDWNKAAALVEQAAGAGADVVKAQYWSSPERLALRRNAADYVQAYRDGQIPRQWLAMLRGAAEAAGVKFACTTYLPEDVWAVAEHCDLMKVASFEAQDEQLLTLHRGAMSAGKDVIVSLGMGASARTVRAIMQAHLGGVGGAGRVWTLHCVSAYPAPVDQLNLRRLHERWSSEQVDGFSDHSPADHTWTGALAVAAGATIIERHIRLDETRESNADYQHSMSPRAFTDYVRHIRYAESVLGDGFGVEQPCEADMARYKVKGQ